MAYHNISGEVVEILTKYDLLVQEESVCFTENGRYFGTDYQGGKIAEGRADSVNDCQVGLIKCCLLKRF